MTLSPSLSKKLRRRSSVGELPLRSSQHTSSERHKHLTLQRYYPPVYNGFCLLPCQNTFDSIACERKITLPHLGLQHENCVTRPDVCVSEVRGMGVHMNTSTPIISSISNIHHLSSSKNTSAGTHGLQKSHELGHGRGLHISCLQCLRELGNSVQSFHSYASG